MPWNHERRLENRFRVLGLPKRRRRWEEGKGMKVCNYHQQSLNSLKLINVYCTQNIVISHHDNAPSNPFMSSFPCRRQIVWWFYQLFFFLLPLGNNICECFYGGWLFWWDRQTQKILENWQKSFYLFGEMQKVSSKVNRRATIAMKKGFWVNLRLIRDRYMSQTKSDIASLRESRVEAELLATKSLPVPLLRSISMQFREPKQVNLQSIKTPKEFQRVQRLFEEDIKSQSLLLSALTSYLMQS